MRQNVYVGPAIPTGHVDVREHRQQAVFVDEFVVPFHFIWVVVRWSRVEDPHGIHDLHDSLAYRAGLSPRITVAVGTLVCVIADNSPTFNTLAKRHGHHHLDVCSPDGIASLQEAALHRFRFQEIRRLPFRFDFPPQRDRHDHRSRLAALLRNVLDIGSRHQLQCNPLEYPKAGGAVKRVQACPGATASPRNSSERLCRYAAIMRTELSGGGVLAGLRFRWCTALPARARNGASAAFPHSGQAGEPSNVPWVSIRGFRHRAG